MGRWNDSLMRLEGKANARDEVSFATDEILLRKNRLRQTFFHLRQTGMLECIFAIRTPHGSILDVDSS